MQQTVGHGRTEMFFHIVTRHLSGKTDFPKNRRHVHAPMRQQTENARLGIFAD